MSALQLLWFILIAVLFIGFFFLEGFDFGVGMATRVLARNDDDREALIATIGPH
ncbi:cytochrome d ubiquinol oxidase subunit II [Agrilactobacillus composti DSM 18527 = JCM 14202]|nr:cytochrome d ubiquinol oxidase subunit II [Agrilactobacillus composti DSM 18527 = JCM 14202]